MLKLDVVCITALLCGTLGYTPISMANAAVTRTRIEGNEGIGMKMNERNRMWRHSV